MLLQFSVQNFLSFRDEAVLCLMPSADREHPENISHSGRYSALNSALVYGANASGKSNIFKALTTALNIIRASSSMPVNARLPVVPFAFDDKCFKQPSKFEFQFIAGDDKKYIYGFSAYPDRIAEEYLYVYDTNRPKKIFDYADGSYSFSRSCEKELREFTQKNTPNKLLLSTATTWNSEITKAPYLWLSEKIDSYSDINNYQPIALAKYKAEYDNKTDHTLRFTEKLLKKADINISHIDIKYTKIDQNKNPLTDYCGVIMTGTPQAPDPRTGVLYSISTEHRIEDKDGQKKSFMLNFYSESMGSQILFYLAPLLLEALENGKTVFLDEIDKSLHPLIVRVLIELFSQDNHKGAQLIATTHDTNQMDLSLLRRDQIYFTEKNQKDGASVLYSLDTLTPAVRKTDNVERHYLQGRYGALPLVPEEF
jgi:AAA15 family ATPase/GTPase